MGFTAQPHSLPTGENLAWSFPLPFTHTNLASISCSVMATPQSCLSPSPPSPLISHMARPHLGYQNVIMHWPDVRQLGMWYSRMENKSFIAMSAHFIPTSSFWLPNGSHFISAVVTVEIKNMSERGGERDSHRKLLSLSHTLSYTSRAQIQVICVLRAFGSLRISSAFDLQVKLQQVLGVLWRGGGERVTLLHCGGREGGREGGGRRIVVCQCCPTYKGATFQTCEGPP